MLASNTSAGCSSTSAKAESRPRVMSVRRACQSSSWVFIPGRAAGHWLGPVSRCQGWCSASAPIAASSPMMSNCSRRSGLVRVSSAPTWL
ncbi:hypothetical protein D3C80_1843120 [compost metagenome]